MFCGLGMELMKMWVTSASWLGEFSCSQAVEMKTILSAWEAVGVGHTTHSCSEFCPCSSHVGPSYCTFCRLSPINGHFWLTALCSDASRHSDYSVPITSLCGLKKMEDLGEDERTSLGKMASMAASQLPWGDVEIISALRRLFLLPPPHEPQTHMESCWYRHCDL